jgi:large subunit ribosomal protein L4
MAVETYTKSGAKSTTLAKLDNKVFGLKVANHQLLKSVYLAHLANGRDNFAKAKKRGEVRGGGQKPWRQKGTGRARFGSSRNPIWTGGGVAFGPTGSENYSHKISTKAKRQALKQALSLAAGENRVKVIDSLEFSEGKVKPVISLLQKIGAARNTLLIVEQKTNESDRATRNLETIKLVHAPYLTVNHVMNADTVVITKTAVDTIEQWLGETK